MVFIGSISNVTLRILLAIIVAIIITGYFSYRLKTTKGNYLIKIAYAGCLLGVLANQTVFFANWGYMPSLSRIYYDGTIWIPMTQTTLYNFLGDRFAGFSIGDLLLGSGFVLLIAGSGLREVLNLE